MSNTDHAAVEEWVKLAASPWRHEAPRGRRALAKLVKRHGLDAVLAAIGEQSPEARMCRVRLRAADGQDVTDALADPDRSVAHTAQSLVEDRDRLRAYLGEAPTDEAKLWAAYRLFRLTDANEAEIRAVYDGMGRPRVEVPGLDEELRRAIVHEYGLHCQWGSDPRWRLEAICTDPPPQVDEAGQLRLAAEAMTAAGFEPQPAVPIGALHRQGGGNYNVIKAGDTQLDISLLGWFARGHTPPGQFDPGARRALEDAGFRWIDDDLAAVRVTDLCVYFFGDRGDLTVDDLLFYWQD